MHTFIFEHLTESGHEQPIRIVNLHGGHGQQVHKLAFEHASPVVVKVFQNHGHEAKAIAESASLQAIENAVPGFAPKVFQTLTASDTSAVVMEFMEESRQSVQMDESFALNLSKMHQTTHTAFGFEPDTFIAGIRQNNKLQDTWADFYIAQRLEPIFESACETGLFNNADMKAFEALLKRIALEMPPTKPALIHGDLWNGNVIKTNRGRVLIDACVGFGHYEMDLAMMHLFGGFSSEVYSLYHEHIPKVPDYDERLKWYQLYYLLIHVILFGRSYVSACRACFR